MVGYAIPMVQSGGRGMPVYSGQRRQMGGNLFSTIKRLAMPLLRHLWPIIKAAGKRVGKSALNVGTGLASDLVSGRAKQIPKNFRNRSKAEINSLGQEFIGQDIFSETPSAPPQEGGSNQLQQLIKENKQKKELISVLEAIQQQKGWGKGINRKRKAGKVIKNTRGKKKRNILDKDIFAT
jgi:hypothetical protein